MVTLVQWGIFHLIIAGMLAIDLGLFQRKAHAPSLKEAAGWSVTWITAAAIFGLYVHFGFGNASSVDFATAYVIEKSLSVDNLFVFAVIFRYFHVEFQYQHKVLFWGILGAIITRGTFILAGVALVETFNWMLYIFGAILVYSGISLARHHGEPRDPDKGLVVRLARRFLPMTTSFQEGKFFGKNEGKTVVTPLFLTLLAIEATDIAFAIDSVPAVLVITTDLFIVYTSNIFAILGLRALYFLLIGALLRLRYLYIGLAVLLTYLGAKVFVSSLVKIPTPTSLLVVAAILSVAVIASILKTAKKPQA